MSFRLDHDQELHESIPERAGRLAFERYGFVLGPTGRFSTAAAVSALIVLHDLSRALENADLTDARNILPIPLHAEFEVLIRVTTLHIDSELDHRFILISRSVRQSAKSL